MATTLKFLRYHCLDRHHCAVQYYQLIDRIIQRFCGSHRNIELESTVMRNWYQLTYTLNKSLATGEAPDLFFTSGAGILESMAARGLVYDLSAALDRGWRETFIPAALQPLKHEGREFAVPLEQGFIFVWYNRRIFQECGLAVPRTFGELLEVCRVLAGRGFVPFSMGLVDKWFGDFFFSYLFQRIGGEEIFVNDFTRSPHCEQVRESFFEAAEKLLQLARLGAFPEDCAGLDYPAQRRLFIQGKSAMWLNGNRLLAYLQAEGPQLIDHLDFFLFPAVEGGRGRSPTVFGGSLATYAVSARSRHKEAAVLFLKTLTDRQAAREVIFEMGDLPAVNHVPYGEYACPLQGRIAEAMAGAQAIRPHYFKYLDPKPAGIYLNVVAGLIENRITAAEACAAVVEALRQSEPGGAAGNSGP